MDSTQDIKLGFDCTPDKFSLLADGQGTQAFNGSSPDEDSTVHQREDCTTIDRRNRTRLKATGRQRKYRERLRSEREHLLLQVNDLSTQLRDLKQDAVAKIVTGNPHLPPFNPCWESALEQHLERLRSEAEHKRLQAAVHSHGIYIKKLIHERLEANVADTQTEFVWPHEEPQMCTLQPSMFNV